MNMENQEKTKTTRTTHDDVIWGTGQFILYLVLLCFNLKYAVVLNLKNKLNFYI